MSCFCPLGHIPLSSHCVQFYFSVSGKLATSPTLEGSDLMKKRLCSDLQFSVPYFSRPDTSRVSPMWDACVLPCWLSHFSFSPFIWNGSHCLLWARFGCFVLVANQTPLGLSCVKPHICQRWSISELQGTFSTSSPEKLSLLEGPYHQNRSLPPDPIWDLSQISVWLSFPLPRAGLTWSSTAHERAACTFPGLWHELGGPYQERIAGGISSEEYGSGTQGVSKACTRLLLEGTVANGCRELVHSSLQNPWCKFGPVT